MSGPGSGPTRAVLPSDQQRDFWLMQRVATHRSTYNIASIVPVRGELPVQRLRTAAVDTINANAGLRVSFPSARADLQVLVWDGPDMPPPDVEASSSLGPGRHLRWLHAEARTPFDLGAPGLLRVRLASSSPDRHELMVGSHHMVLDGTALEQVVEELLLRCGGVEPPSREPYSAYVTRQTIRRMELGERDVTHWRDVLPGAAAASPLALPYRSTDSADCGVAQAELDADTRRAVGRVCSEHRVTPFMVVLAALGAVVSRRTSCDDLVLGMPVDDRDSESSALGNYTAVRPLRLRLDAAGTGGWLRVARAAVLETLAHSAMSMSDLLLERPGGTGPPWRVIVNGVSAYPDERTVGSVRVGSSAPVCTGPKADLALTAVDDGRRIRLLATYPGDQVPRAEVRALLGELLTEVRELIRPTAAASGRAPRAARQDELARRPAAGGSPGSTVEPHGPVGGSTGESGYLGGVAGSDRASVRLEPDLADRIAQVLGSVLGRSMRPDDDFFDCGGTSVSAALAVAQLHAVGVPIKLGMLFSHRATAAALAQLAGGTAADDPARSAEQLPGPG